MNNVYYLLYITKKKLANKVKNTTKSKTNVLPLVKKLEETCDCTNAATNAKNITEIYKTKKTHFKKCFMTSKWPLEAIIVSAKNLFVTRN